MQILQVAQLLDLLQVDDVVTMQIQCLEAWEIINDLVLDLLQVVVGQIDPQKSLTVPHNVFEHS